MSEPESASDASVVAEDAPAPRWSWWSPPGSLWSRAAVVAGLVGIALTQPLLDLMGQNPEFFIAGRYSSRQIIEFALIVALVPALVLVVSVLLTSLVHRRVGDVAYQLVLAGLGALFGNVLGRGVGLEGGKAAIAAGFVGAAAVLLLVRVRPGRMLLEYLAVANVFFLVGFLVISPTSRLIGERPRDLDLGTVSMPDPPGPVVVIVFDETPLSTLLSEDGTVNEERFPAFARLADSSTWYRNASSNHHRTERAVPELLTGVIPPGDALPSYIDLPRNLITMMAPSVPVERYEAITDMCPRSLCTSQSSGSLDQSLRDAAVVYGHRVLPRRLRERLPAIDQGWGGFGDANAAAVTETAGGDAKVFESGRLGRWWEKSDAERSPATQAAIVESQGAAIDGDAALHFMHVVVPHAPWVITPWGTSLMGGAPARVEDPADPAYEWSGRLQYQRHTLQVGAADVALGTVLDHLEEAGLWEDTTMVVVADHGTSLLPPTFGRDEVTADNEQEVYRVPMFIKAAGQTEGEVVDDPAQAIDLLPTLADLLDVELDWEFDGHSLLDGSRADTAPLVGNDLAPLFDVVRRHVAQFPEGEDWTALAAVGEHSALVGKPLSDYEIGSPSAMSWHPDFQEEFDSLPTADGRAPQLLTGAVITPDGERPPELVVSVNGTIAGALGGYLRGDSAWRFGSVLGPFLVDGANDIRAYEVDGQVLRPLGS